MFTLEQKQTRCRWRQQLRGNLLKQYRWRSDQLMTPADSSAPYISLHQAARQKLLRCPALLLQRLVKLYLACRRNRCTGPARTWDSPSTCLPPCSRHLPGPADPPRFVFTARARFSHIPVEGFPWPRPLFPISRIARLQHAFLNPTPGYPSTWSVLP